MIIQIVGPSGKQKNDGLHDIHFLHRSIVVHSGNLQVLLFFAHYGEIFFRIVFDPFTFHIFLGDFLTLQYFLRLLQLELQLSEFPFQILYFYRILFLQ